ncbi:hypothetical protein ACJ5M8_000713 [Vibrio antiquarius]
MKLTENHCTRPLKSALLVEYRCECGEGFYRVSQDHPIMRHNQIPHLCTSCNQLVYFAAPYPFVRVNNEHDFVHWQTLRGANLKGK